MQLALYYPAIPDCATCEKFQVDTKLWQITIWKNTGQPLPRGKNHPTPCHLCPKCEWEQEKTPEQGRKSELSGRNRKTLELYWRAQAGGELPGMDAITRQNFGLIHEQIERMKIDQSRSLTRSIALLAAK